MEPIRSELNMRRVVGIAAAQALVESDIPLPAGRDAQRILYAQGAIQNQASHCVDGQVQAEGTLTLHLLCLGKDNLPFGMQAATQYSHTVPLADVREGMEADIRPQLLDLRCTLRDQRVHMDAVAELNTVASDSASMLALSDVAGVNGLQRQFAEADIGDWRLIGTESRRMHELVAAPGVQQVLLFSGATQVNSIDLGETSATVTGTLFLSVLYLDEDGQYTHLNQQIPLQDTIPLELDPRDCVQVLVDADAEEIGIALSAEPGMLELDVAVYLKAHCIGHAHMQALADAYAPDTNMTVRQEQVEQMSVVGGTSRVCNFTEGIRIPDTMPEAFRAVFAMARPTVLGVVSDNGQLSIDGIFITAIVYQTDDGSTLGFEEDVPFTCTLDAPYMADAEVAVNMLEVRTSGSGRMLTVNYSVETRALLRELQSVTVAVDAEEAEPRARENGILVNYASEGETLWDIGKRFGVSMDQLRAWNPEAQEPFAEGQPLMILSAAGRKRG